jgi:hypothetical protein
VAEDRRPFNAKRAARCRHVIRDHDVRGVYASAPGSEARKRGPLRTEGKADTVPDGEVLHILVDVGSQMIGPMSGSKPSQNSSCRPLAARF